MSKIVLDICFDGRNFNGTQSQKAGNAVQDVLSSALKSVFNLDSKITMCSRLDAGVSAHSFFLSFSGSEVLAKKAKYALNRFLPLQIRVKSTYLAPDSFNPRFDEIEKTYVYRIRFNEYNPIFDAFNYAEKWADPNKYMEAVKLIKDAKDISLFCSLEKNSLPPKGINNIEVIKENDLVSTFITSKAFGRYEVRYIVGAGLMVGRGKISKEELLDIVNGKQKNHIRYKAPSSGLSLLEVKYPPNLLIPC